MVVFLLFLEALAFGECCEGEDCRAEGVSLLHLSKAAAKGIGAVQEDKKNSKGTGPYKGIIIPHVSKVGGSSLRLLARSIAEVFDVPFHEPSEKGDISHLSGVIFLSDINDYILKDEDKRDFFVIGTYRNPCDAALSHFSYLSERELKGDIEGITLKAMIGSHYHGNYTLFKITYDGCLGVNPPFNDPESKAIFKRYVMTSDTLYNLEVRMKEKYNSADNIFDAASCWMNLYDLQSDMTKCLATYMQLQNIKNVDLHKISVATGTTHANPSQHVRCSDMFDDETMNQVESETQNVLQAFNIPCCST
jgi:hypothetical protein